MSRSESSLPLAISPGEPAGIGPDICIAAENDLGPLPRRIYFTDPDLIQERSRLLESDMPVAIMSKSTAYNPVPSKEIFRRGDEQGFSIKQLRRAKKKLDIKASKDSFDGGWSWIMPVKHKDVTF